eukprot:547216-Rhodomonas_salina.1
MLSMLRLPASLSGCTVAGRRAGLTRRRRHRAVPVTATGTVGPSAANFNLKLKFGHSSWPGPATGPGEPRRRPCGRLRGRESPAWPLRGPHNVTVVLSLP